MMRFLRFNRRLAEVMTVCLVMTVFLRASPLDAADVSGGTDLSAVLRATDKLTARSETIHVSSGSVAVHGPLEILVKRCVSEPVEAGARYAALLEIFEKKPGLGPRRVFSGWMFSDSPSLTSLEHPYYDVSVIACETRDEKSPAARKEEPAPAKLRPPVPAEAIAPPETED